MLINEERQLGRAKNAVLTFLEQRLVVPKIYLDAEWNGTHIDVLAIDREGVGDVHAVLLFARPYFDDKTLNVPAQREAIEQLIHRFESVTAQYKYVGAVDGKPQSEQAVFSVSATLVEKSFSPDGIGRVGFLKVCVPMDGEPQATIASKPERFRAVVSKLADEYVQKHNADWEIRA